ncbi:MAG TPA: 3-hydroxy-5-phosphonooxypentane-2,4-dione thiolase [Nitrososphaerales archaeon]
MDWGINNRLSRIIKPKDGRTVMLAVDHGYFQGPTSGLENPGKAVTPLIPYADALMLTRGMLRTSINSRIDTPVVLRVSGGTSILKELSNEGLTTSMNDVVRLNASAVAMSIFVGGECEHQTLVNLSKLVDQSEEYGIPVLAVTAVGREMSRDARYLGLACRIASEIGAHFVKTYYCEGFEKVVNSCPVPLIIAGGKKIPENEALHLTYNSIQAGAIGVDMGRNIFQSESPVSMIKAVRAIVHEAYTANEAYELFNNLKDEDLKKSFS